MLKLTLPSNYLALSLALCGFLTSHPVNAGGTWTALANSPPLGVNNCLLLTDGTVLGMNGAGQCVKLTPDIHGSYINGTWSVLTAMNSSRLFFSSDVLTNGNVFVAGGEYGDANHYDAELYDALANTWTIVPGSQSPNFNYSDSPSEMLPNGEVLESDSQSTYSFYNVVSNMMIFGGSCGDMNEVCWIKLPNGSIFGVDDYGGSAEHFVSSAGEWVQDAASTPSGFQDGDDANYLLPNGQVFHVGSTTNTGFYTPGASPLSAGTLVNGPGLPIVGTNQLVAGESPGAVLSTGNIFLELAPNGGGAGGGSPAYFYEYNYLSNTFTQMTAPGGGLSYGTSPFVTSMLDLPDGSVLFVGGQNSASLYIYTPAGTPLAAGQPIISSITENLDGSYHLTGTNLNGISEGAMFGDDEQMACNYPLVRLTNIVTGNVYYARTHNWSSTTVQNTNEVTTEFSLPLSLPPGTYSLVVSAVGNSSAPVTFTYAPPAAPTGLTGIAGNAQAMLSWNPVSGATSYNLKRLTTVGTPYYATVATVTGTTCTNTGLVNAYPYSYVVTAVGAQGESTNSAALVLTASGPPPVPANVTATADTFARIDLAWTASYGATSYTISRSTALNGPYTNLTTSLYPFYTDSGLTSGTTCYYIISATSPEGVSGNSLPVSATAEAIANFSFEVPRIGNYQYTPTNAFWSFGTNTGYGSGLIANGSGFSNPNAPEGVQAAFVQSNGIISQLFSGFVPGSNYTVTFFAAERPGNSQTWNVTIDGAVIASYNPGSGAASYANYTATFTATAPTETLAFVGTDLAGGDNTIFIDDVQIIQGTFATVPNFGFETPTVANFSYNPSGGSWTFSGASGNGSGIIANGSGFSNPNAPQGVQAAFVQGHGTITQAISGFTPGTLYQITFEAAQRPDNGSVNIGGQSWNVTINGSVIASYNPGESATAYVNYTANFTATASTETLGFIGTDLAGGDNTIFIDNVTIATTLQPANPVVSLATPTNNAVAFVPPAISLTANVVTNGNTINSVQFYSTATNLIGQVTNPPLSFGWTNPNTGSYDVFAQVTYNGGSVANSPAALVTVINTNVNFGFETPSIGSGNFEYNPSGASWNFTGSSGNGSGLIANGSGFGNPNAPQGVQAAFVQSYGGISQLLYGFTPGTTYTVTYSTAQRSGGNQHGGESWNVMIDNTVITNNNPGATSYATYTATFTASAFTHTLSFVGTDLAGGDNTVFLDNVSISPPISQVPPSVMLTSPSNNAVFSAANSINLAAAVTTNGNSIVGVQFYSNTSNLIAQVAAPYTYAWSNASPGASTIFARLIFNGSNAVNSSVVNIMVTNPPPVTQGIGLGVDGRTLSVSGLGLANSTYYLNTASNLSPPVLWMPIQTNISDGSGNIIFTNIAPTNAQQFFIISGP